jgi:YD repeat-containing protein
MRAFVRMHANAKPARGRKVCRAQARGHGADRVAGGAGVGGGGVGESLTTPYATRPTPDETAGNIQTVSFTYLPRGQLQRYVPPQPSPALSDPRTLYSYNLSGQLTRIIRPDGQRIFHAYDAETGQLTAQVLQDAQLQTIAQIDYACRD